ncbi:MAG: hypothetical protein E3J87_03490 [Candidatus Cloacimonadota bacterium]|nr:MAG: hypothetical protein E3J87_03490 [Candidatus Cloacimonadota bacterium]
MSKLKEEELLDWLDDFKYAWSYYPKASLYKKGLVDQAYQQIREMIQKQPKKGKPLMGIEGEMFNKAHKNQPEITEEWIEEKANELWLLGTRGLDNDKLKDFIRSLAEAIK